MPMDADTSLTHRLKPRHAEREAAKARRKEEAQARRQLSKQRAEARRRGLLRESLHGGAAARFNPAVPVGTGFHELRGVRIAYDLTTGAPGNPDGPWKTTQTQRMYAVPQAVDPFTRRFLPKVIRWNDVGYSDPFDPESGDMFDPVTPADTACLAPMLAQYTGQCYLAAVLNMLLAMPEFKNLMQRVFARVPEALLGVIRHTHTVSADVPLPLGLALLQVIYKQYNRTEFEATPAVAVLEHRLQGENIARGGGGWHTAAIITMCSALGLQWAVTKDVSAGAAGAAGAAVPDTVLIDVMYVTNVTELQPLQKNHRRSAGAVIVQDATSTTAHAYAALDCNLLFDSYLMFARHAKWRAVPLDAAHIDKTASKRILNGVIAYVSPTLDSDGVADGVIRACVHAHDYMAFAEHITNAFKTSASTVLLHSDLTYTEDWVLTGPQTLTFMHSTLSQVHIYGNFTAGTYKNSAQDWPAVIVDGGNHSVSFIWTWRGKGAPTQLDLVRFTKTYVARWKTNPKPQTGNIIDMDKQWLPPRESIPRDVLVDNPWIDGLYGSNGDDALGTLIAAFDDGGVPALDALDVLNTPDTFDALEAVFGTLRTKYSAL